MFDPELESFKLRRPSDHQLSRIILKRIKEGWMNCTPGIMKSITRPDWKRELVEAICLSKVPPNTDEFKGEVNVRLKDPR